MRYEERPICRRCVLPASPPEITLDEAGLCNVCRAFDRTARTPGAAPPLETDFTQILAKHRGKHEYDCLVMCSGGKDSTASLYYMVRRYKANVLAFMFDHGFETPEAIENVHRAVDKLGVDFVSYRSSFMHDAFARMIKDDSRAVICHLCSMWYMDVTYRTAARFDTPLIIAGWTKGQSQQQAATPGVVTAAPEYAAMARATKEFLEQQLHHDPKYADFPTSMDQVAARARKRHKSLVLSPHWFLPYQSEDYVAVIQRELGWRYPRQSYPGKSTNCALNYVSVHNSIRRFGFTHYHIEMSKLIREGLMTRAEALELLEPTFDAQLLSDIARPLGVSYTPEGLPVAVTPAKP